MDAIFQTKLKRMSLLNMEKNSTNKNIVVNVFRNHSFEMVENIIDPFLNFSKINAKFNYSDYDDSLNYGNVASADLNLIWLDLGRYKNIDIKIWLEEKIEELASLSNAPILLAYIYDEKLENINLKISNFCSFCVNDVLSLEKDKLYDYSKEEFSGTRLSNQACIMLAREIGLRYIPAIFMQPIKALVFDMDNTLYNGILGEDGLENLEITDTHKKIYKRILELKQQGFMICIASKNEEIDGIKFFKEKNIDLKMDDFSILKINWNSKCDNLIEIARQLNIGTDSILFIDDNPAEIQNVEPSKVKTFHAKDPELTLNALRYYPGLLKLKITKEDNLRNKDIQANREREILIKKLTPKEYFQKLEIKLDFYINNSNHFERVTQLLNKTNQFILTYIRPNQAEVEDYAKKGVIITVNMSDKLSDSGVIAILVAHKGENGIIELKEMTVSCRALGRNLENIMLPYLFKLANEKLQGNGKIKINYKKGSRNMPAISWLENYTEQFCDNEGFILYDIPKNINIEGLKVFLHV